MSFDATDQVLLAQYTECNSSTQCAIKSLLASYSDQFPNGATQVDMGPADDVHEIHKKTGISLDLFKALLTDALTRFVQAAVVELSSGDESPIRRRRTKRKERTPPERVPPLRLRRRARTIKSESSSSEEAEESEESDSVDEHGNLRGFVEEDESDESESDKSEDGSEDESEGEDEGQSEADDKDAEQDPEPVDTTGEVEVTGERTREERDAALLASAVDLLD